MSIPLLPTKSGKPEKENDMRKVALITGSSRGIGRAATMRCWLMVAGCWLLDVGGGLWYNNATKRKYPERNMGKCVLIARKTI